MFDFGDFAEYSLTLKVTVIVSAILLVAIAAIAIATVLLNRKNDGGLFRTVDITYGAICLAISFALGFIGITMAQGGTITPASSLAVMFFCYFFGFRKSVVICFVFMLLQFLQSPYIVHPMSAVLDYVIPYLSLIFFGVFSVRRGKTQTPEIGTNVVKSNINFLIAALCYMAVRYFSHVLSGILFYGEYALAKGWAVNAYSFAYNSFFLIDAVIAVTVGFMLMARKSFYRFMLGHTSIGINTESREPKEIKSQF